MNRLHTLAAALLIGTAAPAIAAPAQLLPAGYDDAVIATGDSTGPAIERAPIAAEPRDEADLFRLPPDWPALDTALPQPNDRETSTAMVGPSTASAETSTGPAPWRAPTAEPDKGPSLYHRLGRERFIAHSVAAAADVATTWNCSTRKRTCQEGNPVVRQISGKRMSAAESVLAWTAMQAIYIGGTFAVGAITNNPTGAAVASFQWVLTGAHGLAAGLNLRF